MICKLNKKHVGSAVPVPSVVPYRYTYPSGKTKLFRNVNSMLNSLSLDAWHRTAAAKRHRAWHYGSDISYQERIAKDKAHNKVAAIWRKKYRALLREALDIQD